MSQEEKMAMSYGTSFTCRKTVIHLCLSSILQGSDPVRPPPNFDKRVLLHGDGWRKGVK